MTSKDTTPREWPHESDSTTDNSAVPPPQPPSTPGQQDLEKEETVAFEGDNSAEDDAESTDEGHAGNVIDHINDLPAQYRPVPPFTHPQPSYQRLNTFPYQPEHPPSTAQYQSSDNTGFALIMMIILSLAAVGIFSVLALLIYRLFFGG